MRGYSLGFSVGLIFFFLTKSRLDAEGRKYGEIGARSCTWVSLSCPNEINISRLPWFILNRFQSWGDPRVLRSHISLFLRKSI